MPKTYEELEIEHTAREQQVYELIAQGQRTAEALRVSAEQLLPVVRGLNDAYKQNADFVGLLRDKLLHDSGNETTTEP